MIGLAALGFSMSANAVNVGGVVWDPDSLFDWTSVTSLVEDQLNLTPGPDFVDTLTGFGRVTTFNGESPASFCPSGCELTFEFGGFQVDTTNIINDVSGTHLGFNGGWIDFYVDHSADFDSNDHSSSVDGNLWLRLEAHEVFNAFMGDTYSIVAELTSFGAGSDAGEGKSLMDVAGGLAAGNFDTDGKADGADMVFTSEFQPLPNGGTTADGYELVGSATLSGNSIPEPTSIALIGLGLLGFAARRRKA